MFFFPPTNPLSNKLWFFLSSLSLSRKLSLVFLNRSTLHLHYFLTSLHKKNPSLTLQKASLQSSFPSPFHPIFCHSILRLYPPFFLSFKQWGELGWNQQYQMQSHSWSWKFAPCQALLLHVLIGTISTTLLSHISSTGIVF